jgi:hypothetical protein
VSEFPGVAEREAWRGDSAGAGFGALCATVQREANTLAYIDGFWLTVWFAIAALGLVALIGRAPPGPFTPKSDLNWLPRRLRQAFAR